MYSIDDLLTEIDIMLSTLWIKYKRVSLGRNFPDIFEVPEFGAIVLGIEPADYSFMLNKLSLDYKNYRYIFITTIDNLFHKKDEVVWDLARSGYIRYLRLTYTRQFNDLIHQGFGRKIIQERLRVWKNDTKFKYLREENKKSLEIPSQALLAYDPAFFDYMPEETA